MTNDSLEYQREYYIKNRERMILRNRIYYYANREKCIGNSKRYFKRRKEELIQEAKEKNISLDKNVKKTKYRQQKYKVIDDDTFILKFT